jgi:LPPG:FO 2-phospho-L-lactate transferase
MSRDLVVALSGGIGGAKLALGLSRILSADNLLVVANVGDDFEHLGLHISPDTDTLMYTLAGLDNTKLGWGRQDETWSFMETLTALGGEDWFRLGDRDLAVHVERTRRLRRGETLSAITADFCRRLGVRPRVLPATDHPVRTRLQTDKGGSISRTTSCVFNAALSCGSLPSKARRMRALILTFWGPCATNGCAR